MDFLYPLIHWLFRTTDCIVAATFPSTLSKDLRQFQKERILMEVAWIVFKPQTTARGLRLFIPCAHFQEEIEIKTAIIMLIPLHFRF